jgi:hypothetical protein
LPILAFILVLAGSLPQPTHCSAQANDGKSSVDVLLTTDCLYDRGVGYAGIRTAAYNAFSQLYKGGTAAVADAKRLVADGTPEGRIYGLLILRHVAPAEAEALTNQLLRQQTPVRVMNGCIVHRQSMGEIVDRIRKGEFIIWLPE